MALYGLTLENNISKRFSDWSSNLQIGEPICDWQIGQVTCKSERLAGWTERIYTGTVLVG